MQEQEESTGYNLYVVVEYIQVGGNWSLAPLLKSGEKRSELRKKTLTKKMPPTLALSTFDFLASLHQKRLNGHPDFLTSWLASGPCRGLGFELVL